MIGIKFDNEVSQIDYFVYSGGEVSISQYIPTLYVNEITIVARIETSDDFFALALLKDILDRQSINRINLELSYVPYARQDRIISRFAGNQALSIRVFTNLLNSLNFSKVIIDDPHSTVTPALINNCVVVDRLDLVRHMILDWKTSNKERLVLLAPDIGALKSVQTIASEFDLEYTFALKTRNPENGFLEVTSVPNDEIMESAHVLVLDDICDGGATFNALSFYLDQYSLADIKSKTLYVTHGIFSKGLNELLKHYDEIRCYNLFTRYEELRNGVKTKTHDNLHVFYR